VSNGVDITLICGKERLRKIREPEIAKWKMRLSRASVGQLVKRNVKRGRGG